MRKDLAHVVAVIVVARDQQPRHGQVLQQRKQPLVLGHRTGINQVACDDQQIGRLWQSQQILACAVTHHVEQLQSSDESMA